MKTPRQKKGALRHFTLIELIAVIAILGALTMLILPKFMNTENDAKMAVSQFNASGLMRFLEGYQASTGEFPQSMHTGLDQKGTDFVKTIDANGAETSTYAMPRPLITNMQNATAVLEADGEKDDAFGGGKMPQKFRESLAKAGVKTTFYGFEGISGDWGPYSITDAKYPVRYISKDWYDANGDTIMIRGKGIGEWATYNGAVSDYSRFVVLFFTETSLMNAKDNEKNNSRLGLAAAPVSPLVTKGQFGYYAVVFYAFNSGKAAYIYTIISPEGETLQSNAKSAW